jgi:putative colanic acid biosynthesis acetyltransferase WcaF
MSSEFKRLRYVNTFSAKNKLGRFVWSIVYVLLFWPTPRWTLHWWRRSLLRLFGAEIGRGSRIAPSARIWAPWNLVVGEYTAIGDRVNCYSMALIRIGSKVAVSEDSFLCTGSHDVSTLSRPLITKPIDIADHVWIAARAFVHPGSNIGAGAIIGSCSVVVRDLPAWTICAGNPCRPLGERCILDNSGEHAGVS